MQPLSGVLSANYELGSRHSCTLSPWARSLDTIAAAAPQHWPSIEQAEHQGGLGLRTDAVSSTTSRLPPSVTTPDALAALLHASGSHPGVTPELLTALLHTHSGTQETHVTAVTPEGLAMLLHGHNSSNLSQQGSSSAPPAFSQARQMQPLSALIHQQQQPASGELHSAVEHCPPQQQQQQQALSSLLQQQQQREQVSQQHYAQHHRDSRLHQRQQHQASCGQALNSILQQQEHALHQQQRYHFRPHAEPRQDTSRTALELALSLHQSVPSFDPAPGSAEPSPASSCLSDLLHPSPSQQSSGSHIPAHYPEASGGHLASPGSADAGMRWHDPSMHGLASSAISVQPRQSHHSAMSHLLAG